ncbi:fumarylacetoacetate hydrolase family protein [Herminiimonas sp. CN]|uniref:fumarylacetoacetate hydrolase family protein n=1 Tax=Herminiimonas sp. CN TaxID=1349818 RepID=UPI0009DCC361
MGRADGIAAPDCGLAACAGIELRVNGVVRQQGALDRLIWSIPEIIAHCSQFYASQPGDLLEGRIGRLESLSLRIV